MSDYNKKTESDNSGGIFGLGFVGIALTLAMIFLGRSCFPGPEPRFYGKKSVYEGFPTIGWILIIIGIIIGIITVVIVITLIKDQISSNKVKEERAIANKEAEDRRAKALEHSKALTQLVQTITNEIVGNKDFNSLKPLLANFEEKEKKDILIKALNGSLETFLEDGIFDETEEQITKDFAASFGLTQKDLEDSGLFLKIIKLITISELLQGKFPDRFKINESEYPINLMKNEHIIWITGCSYYETTAKTQFVGASRGVNIRIAKGIYYRTSGFKGQPVITTELRYKGCGMLFFTNKHLYYHSTDIAFRIKYDKIMTYYSFEDGLGVMKDGTTAKPQYFKGFDGWFAYNIVKNVGNIA